MYPEDINPEVKEILLKNSDNNYYSNNGFTCEVGFLEREKRLFEILESYNQSYVDPELRQDSQDLLNIIKELDIKLFEYTANNYGCYILNESVIEYGIELRKCICDSQQ